MPNIKDVRRHQLGLVLIGACLNGDVQREKILTTLCEFAVNDGWVKDCLFAIADGDREGVYGFLIRLGVNVKGDKQAVDAIISRMNELHEQEELESTMRAISQGQLFDSRDDLDTVEKRIETLLALVRNQRKKTFSDRTTFRKRKECHNH